MRSGNHRHHKRHVVPADQPPGELPVVDGARAVTGGLCGVSVIAGMKHLDFISVEKVSGDRPKKHAVDERDPRLGFDMEDKIAISF